MVLHLVGYLLAERDEETLVSEGLSEPEPVRELIVKEAESKLLRQKLVVVEVSELLLI